MKIAPHEFDEFDLEYQAHLLAYERIRTTESDSNQDQDTEIQLS